MSVNEFETDYWYSAVFIVLLYNLIGIIIVELCRRYQGIQIIFCSIIIPIVPTYIYFETMTLWSWIRLALILSMCITSIIIRYSKIRLLQWILSTIFILSIIGPLIVELSDSIKGNTFYLNGLSAAILLICTNLPFPSTKTIFISNVDNKQRFHYQINLLYIIAFTLWNYVFLLNDQCFEKLLIASIHLLIPIWLLIMGKLKFCTQFCLKSDIVKSEWFILRLYSFLFLIYIDALPEKEIINMIPFWNLYKCSEMTISPIITWTCNITSFLCASLLLFFQIYPLINPTIDITNDIELEKNIYDTKHAALVDDITVDETIDNNIINNHTLTNEHNDNDNTLSTTTTATQTQTQSTQNNQQINNQQQKQETVNNNNEEEIKTLSLIQWIIKRCKIIQYDDKNYFMRQNTV